MGQGEAVQLIFKNPSKPDVDFSLEARLGWDVFRLKEAVAERYEGNPPPREQKLIYAGRVLRDTAVLEDVLGRASTAESGPLTLHLVVKPGGASQPTSPALSPAVVQQPEVQQQQHRGRDQGHHHHHHQQQQQRVEERARAAQPAPSPPTSFSPVRTGAFPVDAPPAPAPAPAAVGGFDPALLAAYPEGLAAARNALPGWTPPPAAGAAGVPAPELPRGYMPVPVFFPMPVVTPQMVQAAGLPMMPEAFNNSVPWAFMRRPDAGEAAAAGMPHVGMGYADAGVRAAAAEGHAGAATWQQVQLDRRGQQQDGAGGGAGFGAGGGVRDAGGAGGNAIPERAAGGAAAAAPAAANQEIVRVIRIDVRLIIKLMLIVMVMTQDASDRKFYGLMAAAIVVYFHQTGLLMPLLRWLRPRLRGQGNADAGADRGGRRRRIAGGLRPIASAEELAQQPALSTFAEEAVVLAVGLVTSIFPGFHDDPDGALRCGGWRERSCVDDASERQNATRILAPTTTAARIAAADTLIDWPALRMRIAVAAAARLAMNDNEPAPMMG